MKEKVKAYNINGEERKDILNKKRKPDNSIKDTQTKKKKCLFYIRI